MTGMLVCMGVMALMMWAMRGRGLTCMRGHGHGGHDPEADLQREEQLRASR
jgi:hypothetical protein